MAWTPEFLRSIFRIAVAPFGEKDLTEDPMVLFNTWWTDARKSEPYDYTACSLATVGEGAKPSLRIVLLKGFGPEGFTFFTNYESRKSHELEANPKAALCFHWASRVRQVRIEGSVEKATTEVSDAYFHSRPRGSRLGAIASRQSRPLPDRSRLEADIRELDQKFGKDPIPRPAFWGGWVLKPTRIEFWQARVDRLHDRFIYERKADGTWAWARYYP